ncbi:MAG: hypothetical protein ABIS92_16180 [Polyangia bacterium]
MIRALVVNDYSLRASWDAGNSGESPLHFLYGTDYLAAHGFQVTLLSEERSRWLAALDRRLNRSREIIGSIDRQVAALGMLGDADVIYAACQTQIQALSYLRALGLIRAPLVCLAHHPLVRGRLGTVTRPFARLMLRGLAALPTLSERVAVEANGLSPNRPIATALRWGPHASFYPQAEYPGEGILAAGRTARDFVTFGRAATQVAVPATILCPESSVQPVFGAFGPTVRLMAPRQFLEYRITARMFSQARALAIPMVAQDGLCGLTSLLDALGAGKPVIMTRNPGIDLDVEEMGIGRWVEAGDVNGWCEALRFFTDHPDAAATMGRRARALVDGGLNYESFSRSVAGIIRRSVTGLGGVDEDR